MYMKKAATIAATLLLVACGSVVAAQTASDPGFIFVDVNNDGQYNQAQGDIALGTNINQLTLGDGKFNTQVSKGSYRAPRFPASLVIPASVSVNTTTPLDLRAGGNITINSTVNAPSLYLQSGSATNHSSVITSGISVACCPSPVRTIVGDINLTGAVITVTSAFVATAGGSVTFSGAQITDGVSGLVTSPKSTVAVYAGKDILGLVSTLTAGSIYLESGKAKNLTASSPCQTRVACCNPTPSCPTTYGGNINISSSSSTFTNVLALSSGNDAIIYGATVTGMDYYYGAPYASVFKVVAKGDILGGADPTDEYSLAVGIGKSINFEAGGDIALGPNITSNSTYLTVVGNAASVSLRSGHDVALEDNYVSCPGADPTAGAITVTSNCGKTELLGTSVQAGSLTVDSGKDVNIKDNGYIQVQGTVTITSCGTVSAPSKSIQATGLNVSSRHGIDMSSGNLGIYNGAICLSSCDGNVTLANAFVTALQGLSLSSGTGVDVTNANITAGNYVKLSSRGKLQANSSQIHISDSAAASSYINAYACGLVDAPNANWSAPADIYIRSRCGNVNVPSATFTSALTTILACWGTIDVTGTTIPGAYTLGPTGVTVIGTVIH